MTIAVISDDDSLIGALRCDSVDLLISCGDLPDAAIQKAVAHYRPKQVFAVRGNHDTSAPFPYGITDLHLEIRKVDGIRFGGFGGAWRYKPVGHHLFDQREASALMRHFPSVDVFIAHNSPSGIHERDRETHQGFEGFRDYIDRVKPRLFIHGHQHHDRMSILGGTTILSVFGEKIIHFE